MKGEEDQTCVEPDRRCLKSNRGRTCGGERVANPFGLLKRKVKVQRKEKCPTKNSAATQRVGFIIILC